LKSRPYFEIANPELPRLLESLPHDLDVLDVACGSGVHGAELKRLYGHGVIGVDLSASSIEKAKTRLAEAYVADITRPDLYPPLGRSKFDIIVLSDIFEHVADPVGVLVRHLPFLAPGGYVLISVPNIAIWNVRLEPLFGRFEYQDTGTLDRTHMRFFTRNSVRQFLAEAGLEVRGSRITPGIARPVCAADQKDLQPDVARQSGGWRFFVHHGVVPLSLLHAVAVSPGTCNLPSFPRSVCLPVNNFGAACRAAGWFVGRRVGTPRVSRGPREKDAKCSSLASV
jgi:SAM-dependent methyltransferase